MIEYRLGYFARSLCGHDKDRLYMIVEENGDMVSLCDGKYKTLAHPKKKKKKHVQIMKSESMAQIYPELIRSQEADRLIRAEISKRDKYKQNKTGGL